MLVYSSNLSLEAKIYSLANNLEGTFFIDNILVNLGNSQGGDQTITIGGATRLPTLQAK